MPTTSNIGSQTITNQISSRDGFLDHADEAGRRLIHLGLWIEPGLGRDDGRDRLEPEGRRERRERGLVLEPLDLRERHLDVATDCGELLLDVEDIAGFGRRGHDRLEGLLGDPQVHDARVEVDHLGGDILGVGLGCDHARRGRP